MLKHFRLSLGAKMNLQPPSGGCVLKPRCHWYRSCYGSRQPPSGGCVLKQKYKPLLLTKHNAATFGWLCVETEEEIQSMNEPKQPPSGGCVLKLFKSNYFEWAKLQPPSGGCVLKPRWHLGYVPHTVAAAFGRLCVETAGDPRQP